MSMNLTGALVLIALGGALSASLAAAHEPVAVTPDEMQWVDGPASLPPGAQMTVLSGNPGKPESFVLRVKFPAGFEIPAHTHPTAEHVTIISGTFNIGHGDRLDRSLTKAVTVGGFIELPADHAHFAWTETATVVQIHGEGPFSIRYMDPADDPRKRQASR